MNARAAAVLLLAALATGCAGTGLPAPVFQGGAPALPTRAPPAATEDPFRLTDARRDWLAARVDLRAPERERLDAIVALFGPGGPLALDYELTTSLDAGATLDAGVGNCLGFTVAFVALARAAGLDARVQEVVLSAQWSRRDEVVVANRHVVAAGRLEGRTWEVDFGRLARPAAAPRHLLDDREVAALLASNQGAAALLEGDVERARERLGAALALDADLAQGWINLAVLHARAGEAAAAEGAFREALRHAPGDASALSGLVRLYRSEHRPRAAERLEAALPRLLRRNPYWLYREALAAEDAGAPAQAARLYRRALRRSPAEPWFHLGLIRARLHAGEADAARQALADARRALGEGDELVMVLERLARDAAAGVPPALSMRKPEAGGGAPQSIRRTREAPPRSPRSM
jgi:Tfp pilus assembly protein PilF